MTATDELRKLLDERGIVWMDVRRPTFLRTCWKTGDADVYCYFDEEKSTGVIELTISGYDFTPEQAIAATLGSGTLTAEQVRELMKDNSCDYPSPTDPYVFITEYDWQAIADELNATLGRELPYDELLRCLENDYGITASWDGLRKVWLTERATLGRGECELHDCEGSFSALNRPVWRCDCGAFMTQYTDATTYHKPRFCPNCGRKVRR